MKLSIVVVNYNTAGLLREFLRAVMNDHPIGSFEIVVVDNGSRDHSKQVLDEFVSRITFIDAKRNLGYSRGTNLGLEHASGEYVLLVNTDIIWQSSAIAEMVSYLEQHSRVGALGPKLLNADGTVQYSCYRYHSFLTALYRRTGFGKTAAGQRDLRRFLMSDWDHNETRPVDWLMSSCFLLRRTALEAVGTFDIRYFVYFADTDYCRRLWLGGWDVRYLASASLVHFHRRESADDLKTALIHIHDWGMYWSKWQRKQPPVIPETCS